ncbi:hypothetical protein KR044_000376 [Drosophila immigrans]|nr:hypothetical protein KR044_000376 [Drosophila immigrans]
MPKPEKDPCKSFASRIEACLQRNNFQEQKCLQVLEDMRQCCIKWHEESFCCNGIDLAKEYIKQADKITK